jgi:flagellar motility protein MotE (MotC chaperone)
VKSAAFLIFIIVVVLGTGAYALDRRGLLTRETFDLFLKPKPEAQTAAPSPVKPVAFAASIMKREEKLQEDTKKMEELATRLELQKKELEADKAVMSEELKKLGRPKSLLQSEAESEPSSASQESDAAKLVKIYEGMPPEQAAAILENLPDSTVAQILLQMRGRKATQIMAEMSAGKSAAISELLIPGPMAAANLKGIK